MTRPRPRIGAELLPVALILICLAGSWCSIVAMHRRGATAPKKAAAPVALAPSKPTETPIAAVPADPPPPPPPVVPKPAPPPPEDPTEKALARLTLAQTEQLLEARDADKKAVALEAARQAAVAESERARRREALVRSQVEALTDQATRLHDELSQIALERDVLARERDAAKAALAKARARSSYAVLPNKGIHGTWQRPIVIECHNGMATLRPDGPSFSMLELSALLGPRSAPIVAAVAREVVRIQTQSSPDGAPVVPYIFFVVRPDGIRSYYSARAQLERLGIAFGYELVDQDMEVDYPDLDHNDEWDGSGPIGHSSTGSPSSTVNHPAQDRPRPDGPRPGASGRRTDDPAETFVWPSRPTNGAGGHVGAIEGASGDTNPPRGGPDREGRGTSVEPLARGPSTPARDGLGRGGNGVDPLPSGIPVIDLDRAAGAPGTPTPSPSQPGHIEEPRFGRESRLIPINPEAMPGLEAQDQAGVHPGRLATDPSRAGGSSGRRDQASVPDGPGTGPRTGPTPTLDDKRSMPPGTAGSPLSELSGSFDPNQGAPPPLSALARLAGSAGAAGAGATGQPPSGASAPNPFSVPTPLPLPDSLAMDPESEPGEPGSEPGGPMAGSSSRADRKGPLTVDVPFELVVACSPQGVVIHPGGYRLSSKALKANDGLLMKHLKTIVQARRQVDPTIRPRPSIRFLIEPGGSEVYRDARRQTMMSGQDWPVALQVSDSNILDGFTREPW